MYCTRCGHQNGTRSKYCEVCGSLLDSEVKTAQSAFAPQSVPAASRYTVRTAPQAPGQTVPPASPPYEVKPVQPAPAPPMMPPTPRPVQPAPAPPMMPQVPRPVPPTPAPPVMPPTPRPVPPQPAPPMMPPTPTYRVQQSPSPASTIPVAPYAAPQENAPAYKRKKIGLIVGITLGAAAVIALALILALSGKSPVEGTWYSEERGMVLQFQSGELVVSRMPGARDEGNYTFDLGKGEGIITADEEEYRFTMEDDVLLVSGQGSFRRAENGFDIEKFLDEYRS